MNYNELKEQLYKMGRECVKYPWACVEAVIQKILQVYLVKDSSYDAQDALNTMRGFIADGWLVW